jgi:RraA family protein
MDEKNDLMRRLVALDCAAVCDADKTIRVMNSALRPINETPKMVGTARTVRCREDFLSVIKGLKESQAGEVLVVDAGGSTIAVVGELFATEARRRGLAGIVIDGACRDTRTLQTMTDFSVYARHISPMAGTTTRIFATQTTVACGGVEVSPGEVVFGDTDGVIVLSDSELRTLVPRAEEIQRKEEKALARMANGESLLSMLNFTEHYNNREAGRDSVLQFKIK